MRNENWKLLWHWPHYRVMILSRVTWVLKLGRKNNLLKDENIFYWTITLWSASQGKWISILELTSNQVTSSSSKLLSNPCLWILLSSTLAAPTNFPRAQKSSGCSASLHPPATSSGLERGGWNITHTTLSKVAPVVSDFSFFYRTQVRRGFDHWVAIFVCT